MFHFSLAVVQGFIGRAPAEFRPQTFRNYTLMGKAIAKPVSQAYDTVSPQELTGLVGQQSWHVNIEGARQRFQGAQSHIPFPALHRPFKINAPYCSQIANIWLTLANSVLFFP